MWTGRGGLEYGEEHVHCNRLKLHKPFFLIVFAWPLLCPPLNCVSTAFVFAGPCCNNLANRLSCRPSHARACVSFVGFPSMCTSVHVAGRQAGSVHGVIVVLVVMVVMVGGDSPYLRCKASLTGWC